ncbi:hypothetical protein D3C72_2251220 [compost metagenome]
MAPQYGSETKRSTSSGSLLSQSKEVRAFGSARLLPPNTIMFSRKLRCSSPDSMAWALARVSPNRSRPRGPLLPVSRKPL